MLTNRKGIEDNLTNSIGQRSNNDFQNHDCPSLGVGHDVVEESSCKKMTGCAVIFLYQLTLGIFRQTDMVLACGIKWLYECLIWVPLAK